MASAPKGRKGNRGEREHRPVIEEFSSVAPVLAPLTQQQDQGSEPASPGGKVGSGEGDPREEEPPSGSAGPPRRSPGQRGPVLPADSHAAEPAGRRVRVQGPAAAASPARPSPAARPR